jgi:hypothetical protein
MDEIIVNNFFIHYCFLDPEMNIIKKESLKLHHILEEKLRNVQEIVLC